MPYKKFLNSAQNPYHVTCRCINKEWFGLPMEWIWELMQEQLYFAARAFNIKIHSFVLMSNHYHLIVSSPDQNLSAAMNVFQATVSRLVVKKSDRINQLWARRFKRCEITSYHYFLNAYKYVYRNPIEAGLTGRVEDYQFSSLRGLLGFSKILIPMVEDTLLFEGVNHNLDWLNTAPSRQNLESVRKALRRQVFRLPNIDNYSVNPLENDVL